MADDIVVASEATPPILFLDFDGVLNHGGTLVRPPFIWHRPAVEALNMVFEAVPETLIVISSSWRVAHSLDFLRGLLGGMGVNVAQRGLRVIDVTPGVVYRRDYAADYDDSGGDPRIGERGDEIALWLRHAPPETKFAILDDLGGEGDLDDHWVRVDGAVGMTTADADRVIGLLRYGPPHALPAWGRS